MPSSVFLFPGSIQYNGTVTFLQQALFADGTIGAPGIAYLQEPSTGFFRPGTSNLSAVVSGTAVFNISQNNGLVINQSLLLGWGSSGISTPDTNLFRVSAGILKLTNSGDTNRVNFSLATGTVGLNNIALVTNGNPYETTGNTNAVTNAINYTPSAVASSYMLTGVVNVTAWTTPASFTVVTTYRDASGNARTDTAQVVRGSTGAAAAAITAIDRWSFIFPSIDIDNGAVAITLSTTGTFTGTPVYNLQATLTRVK